MKFCISTKITLAAVIDPNAWHVTLPVVRWKLTSYSMVDKTQPARTLFTHHRYFGPTCGFEPIRRETPSSFMIRLYQLHQALLAGYNTTGHCTAIG